MKSLFVKDQEFLASFSLKEISYKYKKDVIRYILAEIENHLNNNHELQFDGLFTLEHIMPQTHASVWDEGFTPDQRVDYLNRLANFVSLEKEINDKLKNDWSFGKKAAYYKKSSYESTRKLAAYSDWTPAAIDQRQEKMAKMALSIWRSRYAGVSTTSKRKTATRTAE